MTMELSQPGNAWNAVNLLTIPEVAAWARVHPKTVYRWVKDGKLPAVQFGTRTVRIPEPAVRDFLARLKLPCLNQQFMKG